MENQISVRLREAAKLVGVSYMTIYYAVKKNELKVSKIGKGYVATLEELKNWVESKKVAIQ